MKVACQKSRFRIRQSLPLKMRLSSGRPYGQFMPVMAVEDLWRDHVIRHTTRSRDLRGPGWSGFGECADEFLRQVDLGDLRSPDLAQQLDGLTDRLVDRWETIAGTGSHPWGIARKVINLFMINAAHHTEVSKQLEADMARHLEIPLDRAVAAHLLRLLRPGDQWPRGQAVYFPGLPRLDPETHQAWQEVAQHTANAAQLTRAALGVLLADDMEFELDEPDRKDASRAVELLRPMTNET